MIQVQISSTLHNGRHVPQVILAGNRDKQIRLIAWDALFYLKSLFSKPDSPTIVINES